MTDHYTTLGVLPSAEAVVITAAYRALAQRYHPDKWHGDPVVAHDRMSEINEAYRVIGDTRLRAEFDSSRSSSKHGDFRAADREETQQAFGDALRDIEDRWKIAVAIVPDLATIRTRLTTISTSLAFAYVATILESKQFNKREEIAASMERQYLQQYFGKDRSINEFARQLILGGHRDAAQTLSGLVDVMGSEINPSLLIKKVIDQHRVSYDSIQLIDAIQRLKNFGFLSHAVDVAELRGWNVEFRHFGFLWTRMEVKATRPGIESPVFQSDDDFAAWVLANLCEGY